MTPETSWKGRLKIGGACAAIVALMLITAVGLRLMSGSHGLQSPTASGSAAR